ncbi:amidase [Aeromicrobium sp.]|uniref:amidase n=1 Tax=Aeromicrobium sp. TaxID=1871063 RepID=UPI003C5AA098
MSGSTRIHAFTDDALGDLDAVGVAASIRSGEIGAREVIEAAIARAERIDPVLNTLVVRDFERAIDQSSSPRPGVFSGVPSVIKDNTDLAGLPTRQGSEAVPPRPAVADAEFTTQLLSTGVIPIGKSTMPEFGFNASTEFENLPPTRNPWNTDYSAGASSGGSAALVASGVLPIAHANDGGGSIRIPAAACGLVGLKPTRGRVADAADAAKMPVNIISNGVVSRTVRDTAHFMAGAEAHRAASGLPRIGLVESASERRLRVGLVLDNETGNRTDDETRAAVQDVAILLEKLGHTVVEVTPPVTQRFANDFIHYWALLAFSSHHFGNRVMARGFDKSRTDSLTRYLAGRFVRQAWRTPMAIRGLKRSEGVYRQAFADNCVDLVLTPTLGHTTPRLGHLSPAVEFPEMFERLVRYAAFTPLNNATGAPAISLPLARTSEGLPLGAHLMALHGDERTLLEIAYELEDARPFARIQD